MTRFLIAALLICGAAFSCAQDDSGAASLASAHQATQYGGQLSTAAWGNCGTTACAGGAGNSSAFIMSAGTATPATNAFAVGSNATGTSPNFQNAVIPGPPVCGSATSTLNCMAPVIQNFTPAAAGTTGKGYLLPFTGTVSEPYFPQWLCSAGLPTGLVTMSCAPTAPGGRTFYIAPTGSDTTGDGSFDNPWASPHQSGLVCGDMIYAKTGNYSYANFASGHWGAPTCAAGNNVAWLICLTFDGCKISTGAPNFGMYIDQSYWGVMGWEVTTVQTGPTSIGYSCFAIAPPSSGATTSIHHIIIANNVAKNCGGGGVAAFNQGRYSFDYLAIVANIAYNSAQNSLNCYSGISMYQPTEWDALPGTHLYIGGNFSYSNKNAAGCAGGANNGGTGIITDTLDGSQSGGLILPYTQQVAIGFNLILGNGSFGLESQQYVTGAPVFGQTYRYNNTIYGNETDSSINTNLCAEKVVNIGYGIHDFNNIVVGAVSTACTNHILWCNYLYLGSASDTDTGNFYYCPSGANTTQGHYGDGAMKLSFFSPASGNNALFWDKPSSCDSCTWIRFETDVYVPSGVANYEFDSFIVDQTDGRDFMWGKQCNTVSGYWQYANQNSSWTNGPIACSLSPNAWHHLIFDDYYVKGDTSCAGGVACDHWGSITVDGITQLWGGVTMPSDPLPTGWTRTYGCQYQMDSSSAGTLAEYADNLNCIAGK